MPEVEVSRCGGVEGALRRLKRLSENSRILQDQREEYFVSPSEEKAAAKKAARKRSKKRREKEESFKLQSQLSHKISLARQHKAKGKDIKISRTATNSPSAAQAETA